MVYTTIVYHLYIQIEYTNDIYYLYIRIYIFIIVKRQIQLIFNIDDSRDGHDGQSNSAVFTASFCTSEPSKINVPFTTNLNVFTVPITVVFFYAREVVREKCAINQMQCNF